MGISNFAGAGLVAAGLAAGLASSNVVDIKGSGSNGQAASRSVNSVPSQSQAIVPLGVGISPATNSIKVDRLVKGEYKYSIIVNHKDGRQENNHLDMQLLDRNYEPLDFVFGVNGKPSHDWINDPGRSEIVTFSIKPKKEREALKSWCAGRYLESACWVVINSALTYDNWSGCLPAQGSLIVTSAPILTSSSEASSPKKKGPGPSPAQRGQRTKARKAKVGNNGDGKEAPEQKGGESPPTYAPLSLDSPMPTELDMGVLEVSFALAVFVAIIAAVIIATTKTSSLAAPVAEVSFDFNSSWGTNLGIGTLILNFLTGGIAISRLPGSNHISTCLLLAGLFGIFIPLGVALYGLGRPGVSPDNHNNVGWYLLASGLILWGAFGQLLVVGLLFRELVLARVLSWAAANWLVYMSKALIVVLTVYAVCTAKAIAEEAPKRAAGAPLPVSMF